MKTMDGNIIEEKGGGGGVAQLKPSHFRKDEEIPFFASENSLKGMTCPAKTGQTIRRNDLAAGMARGAGFFVNHFLQINPHRCIVPKRIKHFHGRVVAAED